MPKSAGVSGHWLASNAPVRTVCACHASARHSASISMKPSAEQACFAPRYTGSSDEKLPAEMEGATPVYGLDLINGCWKSEELWEQHARLKKARLYYNGKPFRDVQFADSRRWQRLTFPDFFVKSGDSMTLEVLEVFPGKGRPLAISEIVLQGGH